MAASPSRNFVCQKCNQRLTLDESLQDINSAAFDLLLGPLSDQNGDCGQTAHDKNGASAKGQGSPPKGSSSSPTTTGKNPRHPGEAVITRMIPPQQPGQTHNHHHYQQQQQQQQQQQKSLNGGRDGLHHTSLIDTAESFVMLPKGSVGGNSNNHHQYNNGHRAPYGPGAALPPSSPYSTSRLGRGPGEINEMMVGGGSRSSSVSTVTSTNNAIGSNANNSDLKGGYPSSNSTLNNANTTNNNSANQNNKGNRHRTTGKLFDLMSAKSDLDHPMCNECTEMLLDSLAKQLRDVSRERDCYIDFLRTVNSNGASEEEMHQLELEIQQIRDDEAASVQALKEIEDQQKLVLDEIALLELESLELDKEEERYWQECNEFQLALQTFHNERDSLNLKYDYDTRQLEKLHKTNVYNDTFCIGHDGHFATINGFRLGRLPTQPVEWAEINAAWGQTLLLLHTIANKLDFEFKTFRLVPLGSFSRIDKIEGDRASYELYGSGEFAIGRVFLNRRFDSAMVAFLNCLQQLGDYAEQQGPKLELPYKINKDRIGDASIKLQFSQDETWTRALKYTLTNTKWILAYASSSAASNMTSYTPSAPSLPISRRASPAARAMDPPPTTSVSMAMPPS